MENTHSPNMKLGSFKRILSKLADEVGDNYEVWLSCDEEGNEFLPLLANLDISMGIDNDSKRVILFPSNGYL